jgi:tRNA nucleotidyltransferase (CCA-adding enzyme)
VSLQVIISHVGTDFDGFASMVLAAKLYPGAHMVFPGRLGPGVEEFYNLHRGHFPVLPLKEALAGTLQRLIVVDTRLASRLGPFREYLHRPDIELHIFDHHPPSAEAVRGDQEWVEAVGAAATLLVERCQSGGHEITPHEATLALIAIHEETGSFRYSSTTGRDLTAAAFMMERGANLEVLSHFLRDPLTTAQRELLEEFLSHGELVKGPAGSLYLASARRSKSVFGLGLLASRVLEVQGTDGVCTVLSVDQETSIAARAGSDAFDMAAWMQQWGGGGHRRAAAASKLEETPEQVCAKLRAMAQSGEVKTLTAADIMSCEVFSLRNSLSVEEASSALRLAGHASACIVDDKDSMVGLVSRTDLEKALDHALGHAPATSVMTHKVVSVAPTATVAEVRRIVVERGIGTIPVLDDERLVGIISRSDLLREMYHSSEEADWQRGVGPNELDMSDVPQPFRDWLDVAEDLAEARRLHLYAVGGFVRDTLLRRATEDLDLVVEGDALDLARDMARHFGGKVVAHEKYMTASVRFPDGEKLDIASARREVYCRPAALPEVAQSNLKSDLYRRDFTINSLAIRLSSDLRGAVIDFFGGLQDLEAGIIRVLHNHSFFDDPSRILRAIRFEQRLGFTIEPNTRQLMKAALEANALTLTRSERLKEELKLALSESNPVKVLDRFEGLKVLSLIHPELKFKGRVRDRTERGLELLASYPDLLPRGEWWHIPMFLFGLELSEAATADLGQRFDWKVLQWPWDVTATMGRLCRRPMTPSEIARVLEPLSTVALTIFATLSPHVTFRQRIELYLSELRQQTPLLNGHDIMQGGVPSGPAVSAWKQAAFDAQRDGLFSDRAGALAWLHQARGAVALEGSEASAAPLEVRPKSPFSADF